MISDAGRRARRSAITMLVLVVCFCLAVVVGFRLLFAEAPSLATAEEDTAQCQETTIQPGQRLAAGQVTVSVFNAGSVSGLANRTLINLQQRGFMPGKVANVPEGVQAGNNVTIITTDPQAASVRLVAAQFKGKIVYAQPTQAQGDNVEVVVGPRYRELRTRYPGVVTVAKPTTICVPIEATPEPPA